MRALLSLALALCSFAADRVFVNGTVVTMDAKASIAEAVAVDKGKIVRTGTTAAIRKLADAQTVVTDLRGRTMLPGFYAAHDHFPQPGVFALTQVDLNSPPIGPVESIADIVRLLRERAKTAPKGEWIAGRGYDDTLVREKRHPTRAELDSVSTDHPVWITHTSGHLGVGNTRAFAVAGVTKDTPQPKGGHIDYDRGLIEESQGIVTRHMPGVTPRQLTEAMRWADRYYVARGVTTTVVAGAGRERYEAVRKASESGDIKLRVNWMLTGNKPEKLTGTERVHVVGVKFWHDGSIQGFTGYLGAPYSQQPAGKQDYRGYPSRTREELTNAVRLWHDAGFQVAVHGNGDAAIDDILHAYRAIGSAGRRHRIEHCQTAREDQLDAMRELEVSPSFFIGHVYYWGDRHRDIFLGPARAQRISPLASAKKRGIRFSIHNDSPVTPVDPLLLVWNAVNRTTRAGVVLGPEQRIAVIDALRAVTSDAAWQNFEENTKGSIEPGKLADFVVLERNPLTVPPAGIRDIPIAETIISGETVYTKGAGR